MVELGDPKRQEERGRGGFPRVGARWANVHIDDLGGGSHPCGPCRKRLNPKICAPHPGERKPWGWSEGRPRGKDGEAEEGWGIKSSRNKEEERWGGMGVHG